MHYGKAILHIKRGSASGKQLRSFFFASMPPDHRAMITSFPAISNPGGESLENKRHMSKSG
jgi:hypothetical protein